MYRHDVLNNKMDNYTTGKKNVALLICIFIFSALILLRDVSLVPIPKVLFIIIATILFVFSSKSDIYCFLAFLAPLSTGTSIGYICIVALVIILVKQRYVVFDKRGMICVIGIVAIEFISVVQGMFSVPLYCRFIGMFCVVALYIFDATRDYDNEKMMKFFLIGVVVAIICLWGQMMSEYSFSEIVSMKIRFGNMRKALDITEEGMRLSFNQNGLGSLCLMASFVALLLHKRNNNIMYLLLVIVFAIQGVMTQSRTFVIVFLICILLYGLFSARSIKSFFKTTVAILFCGLIIYYLLTNVFSESLTGLFLRLGEAESSGAGGRIAIVQQYLSMWSNNPVFIIFGSGLQNYAAKYGMFFVSHTAIVEVIITWGVFGFLFYIVMNIRMIINAKRVNRNFNIIFALPYLCYIFSSFAGQGFSSSMFIMNAMICYAAMNITISNGGISHDREKLY